jgi:uncharacterized protein (DUF427 family)
MWKFTGIKRPGFAEEPGTGQESVWDYPRPPALVPSDEQVEVFAGEALLAQTRNAVRVLETASPPTYYLPPGELKLELLVSAPGSSFCEWKGQARYWALATAPGQAVGWSYPAPTQRFAEIAGWLSFYPGRIRCVVNGEQVRAQAGGFYGGWVTGRIVGPFKGDPGTGGW